LPRQRVDYVTGKLNELILSGFEKLDILIQPFIHTVSLIW